MKEKMLKFNKINVFLYLLCGSSFLSSCNEYPLSNKSSLERGYFEGQKDAINGDIRIKLNSDSIYIWKKSPWDDGCYVTYNPTYIDSQK